MVMVRFLGFPIFDPNSAAMRHLFLVLLMACAISTADGQTLRVLTYNIRLDLASDGPNSWPNRKEFLAGQLRFYAPDIFGVQEALPSQVADLATLLPAYGRIGQGREGGDKGEASNLYYDTRRFTVLDSGTFWLSETPEIPSKGWDAALNRICTYARFRDKHTKKRFWVFNTHLDHVGEQARTRSIALIETRIAALNTSQEPVIFMGDFNSEPQTQRVVDLKTRMDDAREVTEQPPFGPIGTFNGFAHDKPVTTRIDYIFLSRGHGIRVKKYAVLSDSRDLRYPSDHLPVCVDLDFGR